jgi:hypothetical protein
MRLQSVRRQGRVFRIKWRGTEAVGKEAGGVSIVRVQAAREVQKFVRK